MSIDEIPNMIQNQTGDVIKGKSHFKVILLLSFVNAMIGGYEGRVCYKCYCSFLVKKKSPSLYPMEYQILIWSPDMEYQTFRLCPL